MSLLMMMIGDKLGVSRILLPLERRNMSPVHTEKSSPHQPHQFGAKCHLSVLFKVKKIMDALNYKGCNSFLFLANYLM